MVNITRLGVSERDVEMRSLITVMKDVACTSIIPPSGRKLKSKSLFGPGRNSWEAAIISYRSK